MEQQLLSNQSNQTGPTGPTLVDMQRFQKKKSKNGKKILVVLILIAIISAAIYYFFFLNKNNAEPVALENNSNVSKTENKIDKNLDTDNDSLPDYMEKVIGTDANNPDTDSDGYTDLQEIRDGYDPLSDKKYTQEEWGGAVKEKIKREDEGFYEENIKYILKYEADLTNVASYKKSNTMLGARDIIKEKMQRLGVEKSIVEIVDEKYITVDLSGITNNETIKQAIEKTLSLDFRIESSREEYAEHFRNQSGSELPVDFEGPYYVPTDLTGKYITNSSLDLDPNTQPPVVSLEFNEDGKKIFADLTAKNIGKKLAVYLDGEIITAPVINEAMLDGKAVIAGNFTGEEAISLTNKLNAAASSVSIKLVNN